MHCGLVIGNGLGVEDGQEIVNGDVFVGMFVEHFDESGAFAESLEDADGNVGVKATFGARFGQALEYVLVGIGFEPLNDLFPLA